VALRNGGIGSRRGVFGISAVIDSDHQASTSVMSVGAPLHAHAPARTLTHTAHARTLHSAASLFTTARGNVVPVP